MKEALLLRTAESLLRRLPTREFSCLAFSRKDPPKIFGGLPTQQVRFRRHDRASGHKPRPPTKKKRRAYNRKQKKISDEKARHSAPGSKAGPRREWARNRWEHLLSHGKNDNLLPAPMEDEEYTFKDAILEDLISNTSYLTSQPTPEPVYLGHRHRECVQIAV